MDTKFPFFRVVSAVLSHWKPLVTGSFFTVLGVTLNYFGVGMPGWLILALFVVFAWFACFRAWRDEFLNRVGLELYLKPSFSIDHLADRAPYVEDFVNFQNERIRVLRVRVRNIGGSPLYGLHARLEMNIGNRWYGGTDLSLMEEGLPIVKGRLHVPNSPSVPAFKSFSLSQSEEKFVNVVMQRWNDAEGAWDSLVTLCLTGIRIQNNSNNISLCDKKEEIKLVVLGGTERPKSIKFKLSLDNKGQVQMNEVYDNENLRD